MTSATSCHAATSVWRTPANSRFARPRSRASCSMPALVAVAHHHDPHVVRAAPLQLGRDVHQLGAVRASERAGGRHELAVRLRAQRRHQPRGRDGTGRGRPRLGSSPLRRARRPSRPPCPATAPRPWCCSVAQALERARDRHRGPPSACRAAPRPRARFDLEDQRLAAQPARAAPHAHQIAARGHHDPHGMVAYSSSSARTARTTSRRSTPSLLEPQVHGDHAHVRCRSVTKPRGSRSDLL